MALMRMHSHLHSMVKTEIIPGVPEIMSILIQLEHRFKWDICKISGYVMI